MLQGRVKGSPSRTVAAPACSCIAQSAKCPKQQHREKKAALSPASRRAVLVLDRSSSTPCRAGCPPASEAARQQIPQWVFGCCRRPPRAPYLGRLHELPQLHPRPSAGTAQWKCAFVWSPLGFPKAKGRVRLVGVLVRHGRQAPVDGRLSGGEGREALGFRRKDDATPLASLLSVCSSHWQQFFLDHTDQNSARQHETSLITNKMCC